MEVPDWLVRGHEVSVDGKVCRTWRLTHALAQAVTWTAKPFPDGNTEVPARAGRPRGQEDAPGRCYGASRAQLEQSRSEQVCSAWNRCVMEAFKNITDTRRKRRGASGGTAGATAAGEGTAARQGRGEHQARGEGVSINGRSAATVAASRPGRSRGAAAGAERSTHLLGGSAPGTG